MGRDLKRLRLSRRRIAQLMVGTATILAMPGVTFVDGAAGIARRIAWLTQGQAWPDVAPDGIALFTGAAPSPAMAASLNRFGLGTIATL